MARYLVIVGIILLIAIVLLTRRALILLTDEDDEVAIHSLRVFRHIYFCAGAEFMCALVYLIEILVQ